MAWNRAWLIEHETSREEIADLLSVIDRNLDGRLPGLSSDGRMAIAHNAALHVAIVGQPFGGRALRAG